MSVAPELFALYRRRLATVCEIKEIARIRHRCDQLTDNRERRLESLRAETELLMRKADTNAR